MDQPHAIITIIENPVGDGIHTQLMIKTEFYPPLGPDDKPPVAHAAAMVAIAAIQQVSEDAGGYVQEVETHPGHDMDTPQWWSA